MLREGGEVGVKGWSGARTARRCCRDYMLDKASGGDPRTYPGHILIETVPSCPMKSGELFEHSWTFGGTPKCCTGQVCRVLQAIQAGWD
jgi:hypothetical protein